MALRNTSRSMFSAQKRVLLSEHVSPTIRIHYDDAIRPNTNRLFRPLFGTKANTNRIFGTSLDSVDIKLSYVCHLRNENDIVFSSVCLCVCVFVCLSVNMITLEPLDIIMKFLPHHPMVETSKGRTSWKWLGVHGWWFNITDVLLCRI